MQIHRSEDSILHLRPNCDASCHFIAENFCCGTDALHADDREQLKYVTA